MTGAKRGKAKAQVDLAQLLISPAPWAPFLQRLCGAHPAVVASPASGSGPKTRPEELLLSDAAASRAWHTQLPPPQKLSSPSCVCCFLVTTTWRNKLVASGTSLSLP